MRRLGMCCVSIAWIAWIALGVAAGCGDDSQNDAAAAADAGPPPLIEVVRREIKNYDRRVRASCVCAVEAGSYPTEQACLDIGLSGPDWTECATMALKDYDTAKARADSRCYQDFLAESAECTEASDCDPEKLAECGVLDRECLALQNERLNLILVACPDFGLLSRLN